MLNELGPYCKVYGLNQWCNRAAITKLTEALVPDYKIYDVGLGFSEMFCHS